jgi:hypothetical protein
MIDGFCVHRFHDAEFVGDTSCVREQLAEPRTTFAVLTEAIF